MFIKTTLSPVTASDRRERGSPYGGADRRGWLRLCRPHVRMDRHVGPRGRRGPPRDDEGEGCAHHTSGKLKFIKSDQRERGSPQGRWGLSLRGAGLLRRLTPPGNNRVGRSIGTWKHRHSSNKTPISTGPDILWG